MVNSQGKHLIIADIKHTEEDLSVSSTIKTVAGKQADGNKSTDNYSRCQ